MHRYWEYSQIGCCGNKLMIFILIETLISEDSFYLHYLHYLTIFEFLLGIFLYFYIFLIQATPTSLLAQFMLSVINNASHDQTHRFFENTVLPHQTPSILIQIKELIYQSITLQEYHQTCPHRQPMTEHSPNVYDAEVQTNANQQIEFYQYRSDHHNSDYETQNTDFQYIDNPFKFIKRFVKDVKNQYKKLKNLIKQYKSFKNAKNNKNSQQEAQSAVNQIIQLKLLIESQKIEYSTAKSDMKYNIQDCRTQKQLLQKCMKEFDQNQNLSFNNPQNAIILNLEGENREKRIAELKEEYSIYNKWIKKEKSIQTKCIRQIDRVLKLFEWELSKVEAEIEKDRKQKSQMIQNNRSRRYSENNMQNSSYSQKNGQIVNIKKKQPIKRQQIQIKSVTLQFEQQNPKTTQKNQNPFSNNFNKQFIPSNVRMFAKNPKMQQVSQLQKPTQKSVQLGKRKNGKSLVENHVDKSSQKLSIFNQKYHYLQMKSSILLNKSLELPKFMEDSPLVKDHKKGKKVYFK